MVLTMIISSKTFSAEDGVKNEDIISGIMIFKSNQLINQLIINQFPFT